ncbi:MAG: hypothetical protein HOQ24_11735 [Mycobacteriaceae bacterium]|nr:hypothetical protein [Mycobacteriaceae bacterium]
MFGLDTLRKSDSRHWHASAGDAIADNFNVPGIVMVMLGIGALAMTIVAAGSDFRGWTVIGGIATAVLWIGGVTELFIEHRREEAIERRFGRRGHQPGQLPRGAR